MLKNVQHCIGIINQYFLPFPFQLLSEASGFHISKLNVTAWSYQWTPSQEGQKNDFSRTELVEGY